MTTGSGVAAFTATNEVVMNCNRPVVNWSFRIDDLEAWLITLEEIMIAPHMRSHRLTLEVLYFSLKAAHKRHEKQHQEVIENSSGVDLVSYLSAYAQAMNGDVA